MAYKGKTDWQMNDIVMPVDMNRIEKGIEELNLKEGQAHGIATLGSDGKVPSSQLPPAEKITDATITKKGIVKLNSSVESSSETEAATPKAVKTVHEKAVALETEMTTVKKSVEIATESSAGIVKLSDDVGSESGALKINTDYTPETEFSGISPGMSLKAILGRLSYWFAEIGKKLDKSKIANNLATTAEGYALDARQGPPLIAQIDGKAPKLHTHDDRYYTEAEVDARINAINNDINLKIRKIIVEATFKNGIAEIDIAGASQYPACLVQNLSSNEHTVYRVLHDYGSDRVTIVARTYKGEVFNGVLGVLIVLL